MARTKFGTFDELLAISEEAVRPVAQALRQTIYEVDPEACEVVRLGDRAATYGVGPRKMIDGYAYILPHKGWVNLGFYQGANLADPEGLVEGTGRKMRHVKVRSTDEANRPAVRALLKAALELRTRTTR
ncbi:MAG: DUF1801 domain-containing protein [Rhodobacteraceae bacterium]|nr:DUF1801 domain-containing protein [Paracoccaceae bacterium]